MAKFQRKNLDNVQEFVGRKINDYNIILGEKGDCTLMVISLY